MTAASNRCHRCNAQLEPPDLGYATPWCYSCEEREAIKEDDET